MNEHVDWVADGQNQSFTDCIATKEACRSSSDGHSSTDLLWLCQSTWCQYLSLPARGLVSRAMIPFHTIEHGIRLTVSWLIWSSMSFSGVCVCRRWVKGGRQGCGSEEMAYILVQPLNISNHYIIKRTNIQKCQCEQKYLWCSTVCFGSICFLRTSIYIRTQFKPMIKKIDGKHDWCVNLAGKKKVLK